MPTTLRPNWETIDYSTVIGPVDLEAVGYAAQPVPSVDQSATIITVALAIAVLPDSQSLTSTFTCWDGWFDGEDLHIGDRQITGTYVVGPFSTPDDGVTITQPIYLKWVDNVQPQSGTYVVAVEDAGTGSGTFTTASVTLISVAP